MSITQKQKWRSLTELKMDFNILQYISFDPIVYEIDFFYIAICLNNSHKTVTSIIGTKNFIVNLITIFFLQ